MANYQIENPHAVPGIDYIVEQGTNYRKWRSGRLEQWGIVTKPTANSISDTFPIPFINTNIDVVVSNRYVAGNGVTARYIYSAQTTVTSISCFVRDINTGTFPASGDVSFSYYAIGRWK